MKKWMVVVCIICTAGVRAEVLFQDTFDVPDSQDINSDYVSRQSSGTVSSQYTGDIAAVSINGSKFYQEGSGYVSLNASLDSYLTSDFKLSCTMAMSSTAVVNRYSVFYLQSANESSLSAARFGMLLFSDRTSSDYSFMSFYGGTSSQVLTSLTRNELNVLWNAEFGENFDGMDEHTYEFVADADAGTYDVLVDGLTVVSGISYAFADDTVQIKFYGRASAAEGGNSSYDNVTFETIPKPSTVGLFFLGVWRCSLFAGK